MEENKKNEVLMFYNSAKCDIYIGKGAGKKLLHDINNAKRSVKIVSPYLSPFLIRELINLHRQGLKIELITSDNVEDFNGSSEKNIHKLIQQHRDIDFQAKEKRTKWIRITKILKKINFGIFSLMIGAAIFIQEFWITLAFIPIIVIYTIIKIYKNEIKYIRVFSSYNYSKLFPFKVYLSPNTSNQSDTFIHSKIYIIDDEVAYLGSLNFTNHGTKENYETRIRIVDSEAIKKICEEFNDLMYHSYLPERDTQLWGKKLYREPIN